MAPLPDNLTARLFIEYTSMGVAHTMLVRLEPSATAADAALVYADITTILKARMDTDDSFTGARFSAAGGNLSFPMPVSAVSGTAAYSPTDDRRAFFYSWTGRGTDGRDAKVSFFSPVYGTEGNYRLDPGDDAVFGAMATYLNASSEEIVAVSGAPTVWHTYVNMGVSAYWQRKLRRVG